MKHADLTLSYCTYGSHNNTIFHECTCMQLHQCVSSFLLSFVAFGLLTIIYISLSTSHSKWKQVSVKTATTNKQITSIHMHTCMQWLNPWICVLDLLGDTVFSFVQPAVFTMLFPGIHCSVHEIGDGASDYLYPFCTCSRLWPDPDRESLNTIDWLYTQLVWGKLKWNKHSSKCQQFIQWSALLLCSSMELCLFHFSFPHTSWVYSQSIVFKDKLTFSGQLLSLFGSPFKAMVCDVKQFYLKKLRRRRERRKVLTSCYNYIDLQKEL